MGLCHVCSVKHGRQRAHCAWVGVCAVPSGEPHFLKLPFVCIKIIADHVSGCAYQQGESVAFLTDLQVEKIICLCIPTC